MTKKKKLTYNELMSYVNYLERKLTYHINTLNKTVELYIDFKKDGPKFTTFIEKKYKDKERLKKDNEKVSPMQTTPPTKGKEEAKVS